MSEKNPSVVIETTASAVSEKPKAPVVENKLPPAPVAKQTVLTFAQDAEQAAADDNQPIRRLFTQLAAYVEKLTPPGPVNTQHGTNNQTLLVSYLEGAILSTDLGELRAALNLVLYWIGKDRKENPITGVFSDLNFYRFNCSDKAVANKNGNGLLHLMARLADTQPSKRPELLVGIGLESAVGYLGTQAMDKMRAFITRQV